MRKSVIMGIGLALSLAGAAAAQQADTAAPRRDRIQGQGAPASKLDGRGRFGGPGGLLFKDIALSETQKTQFKELRKSQHDKLEANREQRRKQFDELRAARERGDTTAARAIVQRNRQAMEQTREQEIAAIRNILTTEQRVQFDKNVAELKQREAERVKRFGEKGQRGPRGRPGRAG
jgi:Spy/CpxP family protein refolding chaperone